MATAAHHALARAGPVGRLGSRVHRLDPRAKITSLLAVTVAAVIAPLAAWPVFAACVAVLVGVALVARVPAATIGRRAALVLPVVLSAALFLPLVRHGGERIAFGPLTLHEEGLATFAAVALKATIGTISAILLGATTSFSEVLRGLEALRVPRPLVLIAAFMHRYLFVIVAEAARMRAALAARAYRPRTALQAAPLGRMATAMFLRSYARGERVYGAMLARGYSGSMPQLTPLAPRWTDAAFVALVLVLLAGAGLAAA